MVGNGEEVERPHQLHRLAGVRDHFLAAGEAEPVAGCQRRANQAGIERQVGVEVQVPNNTRSG